MGEMLSKVTLVARGPQQNLNPKSIYCITCHNLDAASPIRGEYDRQYDKVLCLQERTLEHLQTSAQSGCRFCDLLCRAHAAYGGYLQRAKLIIWLEPGRPVTLWFTEGMIRDRFVDIYVPSCEATVSRGVIGPARDLPSRSDSEVSFGFLIDCMKRCLETHQACRRTSHSPPTRLLHVGSAGDPIRLVGDDYGSSSSTSYAALSYCWGGGSFVTSTRANIAEHRRRIDWDALPRAFQDAIVVCRRLGVEHLWVDSLCIIQDDERDWELESSKMAAVYENATFMIAPTSLENPERSFFSRPQDPSLAPIILQTGGNDPPIKARQRILTGIHRKVEVIEEPLETRAWAFQEKIFATRYIWYTDAEVQWECKELVACECSAFGRDLVNPILTSLMGVDPFSCWSNVVRQYTRRRLTYVNDRLPALAGVASRIQERTGSAYVAGLWKDHLLQDLCWYPSDTKLRKARSTPRFRAPSFSWASIDGEVAFQSPETATYHVVVIDAQCMLKSANPFGEVIGGFILLEGPLLKAWATSDGSMQDVISLLAFSPAVDEWPNYVPWRHDVALKYGPIDTSAGDSEHGVQRCVADNSEKFGLKPVWCLRLYRSEFNNIWPMQTEEFLVLGLSKTVSGAYDRLGMLSIDLSNLGTRKTKRALEWLEEGIKMTVKIT